MLRAILLSVLTLSGTVVFAADEYPSRQVRMVVPWPTGGTADIVTRIVSQKLEELWRQPVVVDNRGGASGNIGSEIVARSAPDGYTLMYGAMSTHAMNQWLYSKMTFDPIKDFAPVTMMLVSTTVLVAPAASSANSVKDLIALAKAKPGKLNYASVGNGSFAHLAGELLSASAGIDVVHVPYKGGAPAMTDLVAGRVDYLFIASPPAMPHIKAGKIKLLATADAKRSPAFADTPTVAETIPGFDISVWSSIFAPAGTPRSVVDKVNRDVRRVLQMPDVRTRLLDFGADIAGTTPEDLADRMQTDAAKWGRMIKSLNVTLD